MQNAWGDGMITEEQVKEQWLQAGFDVALLAGPGILKGATEMVNEARAAQAAKVVSEDLALGKTAGVIDDPVALLAGAEETVAADRLLTVADDVAVGAEPVEVAAEVKPVDVAAVETREGVDSAAAAEQAIKRQIRQRSYFTGVRKRKTKAPRSYLGVFVGTTSGALSRLRLPALQCVMIASPACRVALAKQKLPNFRPGVSIRLTHGVNPTIIPRLR